MNPDQQLTFDESVREVMKTLPPVVHDYLVQGKYTTVAKGLMTKYGLRIDQGGVLEREIMLFLMGIDEPDEFAEALKTEARIPEEMVRNIMADVNQEVFVPLREQMRKGGGSTQALPPRNTIIPANPRMPTRGGDLNLMHRATAPASLPAFVPTSSHIAPLPPKTILPPREGGQTSLNQVRASGRSSLRDVLVSITRDSSKLLEDHEEPHIEFRKAPPANLPGVMPPPIVPPQVKPAPPAPTKSYDVDPYREPIE